LYVLLALTAFGAGVWVNNTRQAAAPASAAGADAILALSLPDLQNRVQALNQWRGQVLIVNFWATWCTPCREEIPIFVKLQQKYAGKGLQIVGISIDEVDKTREFSISFGINYPGLIGTFDAVEVSKRAGNDKRVLPFTVILGRDGQIARTESGGLTEQKLEGVIKSLL
jgi:thiol-disulfide isomerase/thioredoxin